MEVYMGKQLSPLEKEFLIKTYRAKIGEIVKCCG